MSREAWGDPPDPAPQYCPHCGGQEHVDGCELWRADRRRAAAEGEAARLRAALAELVALKDMKDRLKQLHEMGHGTDYENYYKRKPLAWAAARAALEPPVKHNSSP